MKIGQPLSQDEAPALRQKFAHEKDQQLRDADQDRDRQGQTACDEQTIGPRFGLQNREDRQAGGDEKINQPGREIASHRCGIFIHRGAESEERRDAPETQKRWEREENANRQPHHHSAQNRRPRDRAWERERDEVLQHAWQ